MSRLFRGIFALDRALRVFPSLVQVWLVEAIMVVLLGFFAAKVIDIRGGFGCPGEPGAIGGTFWGALALALVAGFFFVRNLVRPRMRDVSWTPVVGIDVGGVGLVTANPGWTVRYTFLSSHPAYALLHLVTLWLPLAMVLATENGGCSTLYWKAFGIAGLLIIGAIAMLRVLAWYVFRFGRVGKSSVRTEWEMGWRPTLGLVVLMYVIVWVPLGIMFWQADRRAARLPILTLAMTAPASVDAPKLFVRVEGALKGPPVFRPVPARDNRGGNNYLSVAVLVALDDGGEVLFAAKGSWVPYLIGAIKAAKGGRISSTGVLVSDFSKSDRQYYRYTDADLPPADPRGRVLVDFDTP